jgi:hypothetical protein
MRPVLVAYLDPARCRAWGLEPERVPMPFVALPQPLEVREALAAGFAAYPQGERVAYVAQEFLCEFFNFATLYEGGLHRWLEASPHDPLVFRRLDGPEPPDVFCVSRQSLATADPLGPRTDEGEIELALLPEDPRPKTLVFGDSHVWNLYTQVRLIGKRGVVVDVVHAGGVEQLKISRHVGPVTMHRLASRGELTADFFRTYGVRPGDRVVAVCG